MHNFGVAFDTNSPNGNELASMGLLEKYGFRRPVAKEAWHIEDAGIDRQALKSQGNAIAQYYAKNKKLPSDDVIREAGLPLAADGLITNRPAIFGEAGPEMAIPLNDRGIGVMAEAFNKAINLTGGDSITNSGQSSGKMKEYLNNQFIPALAREMAKAMASRPVPANNNAGVNVYS